MQHVTVTCNTVQSRNKHPQVLETTGIDSIRLCYTYICAFEFPRSQISNLQKQMNDHTDSVQTATTSWR